MIAASLPGPTLLSVSQLVCCFVLAPILLQTALGCDALLEANAPVAIVVVVVCFPPRAGFSFVVGTKAACHCCLESDWGTGDAFSQRSATAGLARSHRYLTGPPLAQNFWNNWVLLDLWSVYSSLFVKEPVVALGLLLGGGTAEVELGNPSCWAFSC